MVDHDGGGTLEACNGEYEWSVVDLENVGVHLEILDAVPRKRMVEEKEGQGRSPRDHLDLERSPLLSSSHT